tara:strand:+ start:7377 stop:7904 length:528 start_codon:yes stop_codon:yes gene_type:complete
MRVLFVIFFSFYLQADSIEYFSKPFNFNAEIIISKEEGFISKGKILFRDDSFIYNLTSPYNQTIASKNGKLFIQDDDFQQVIIYENDNSFFLQDLLNNEYKSESIACPNTCFKLNIEQESAYDEALVSLEGKGIKWIRLKDMKDQRIFVKFENFKFESSNINYVVPDNYEIVTND